MTTTTTEQARIDWQRNMERLAATRTLQVIAIARARFAALPETIAALDECERNARAILARD